MRYSRFKNLATIPLLLLAFGCAESSPMGPDPAGDIDSDGIRNELDACLDEPETQNGWQDSDGCPDQTSDYYEFLYHDVEHYWAEVSVSQGSPYVPLTEFTGYSDSLDTACGYAPAWNAVYCPRNHSVYYHHPFLDELLEQIGEFGPALVVSHELGHAVQYLNGFNPVTVPQTVLLELQADCLAGAWAATSTLRNELREHDLEANFREYEAVMRISGDDAFDWHGHGTAGQRTDAFKIGFDRGPTVCLSGEFILYVRPE